MPDQTVNSICAFIISNNDTDFLTKRVVHLFKLFTNTRRYKCLQWIKQNIYLIYRYLELYHGKIFNYQSKVKINEHGSIYSFLAHF